MENTLSAQFYEIKVIIGRKVQCRCSVGQWSPEHPGCMDFFKISCVHTKLMNYKGTKTIKESNLIIANVGDEAIMNFSKSVTNSVSVQSQLP